MGTISVRYSSHPGILSAVASRSVQATVIVVDFPDWGLPFPIKPGPSLWSSLRITLPLNPVSKTCLSSTKALRILLLNGLVGSAVTLRILLSPSGFCRGPFIARLRGQIYNIRAGECKFFSCMIQTSFAPELLTNC
jgi:hypothetical protein